jgi:hypothetical protein
VAYEEIVIAILGLGFGVALGVRLGGFMGVLHAMAAGTIAH